jgi:hypothetical protein
VPPVLPRRIPLTLSGTAAAMYATVTCELCWHPLHVHLGATEVDDDGDQVVNVEPASYALNLHMTYGCEATR